MADANISKLYAAYQQDNQVEWSVLVADVQIVRGFGGDLMVGGIVFHKYRDDLPDEEAARAVALLKNNEASLPKTRIKD